MEVDRPRRIVEEIRVGRRGRNRSLAVYDFISEAAGVTRVELTTYSEPATRHRPHQGDRARAGWMRRKTKKSLERLRTIFEEPPQGAAQAGDDRGLRAREGGPLRRRRPAWIRRATAA